ncbi:MAG: hypothetical protein LCH37_11600 [Bacteroidetes bacterium]|nr:hypothetical protein [Bacteroidota bacterium]
MRFTVLLGLLFLASATQLAAQQLLLKHKQSGKEYLIGPGDKLSILYKGYLQQTEKLNLPITYITDSSVCFGNPYSKGTFEGNSYAEKHGMLFKEVLFKDIQFFRKIGIGRQLLKSTLNVSASLGTIVLFAEVLDVNNMSILQRTAISLGFGFGTRLIINQLLPEYPKNKMADYTTQLIY